MEDEFSCKIVSMAGKRAPLPEKEALLALESKKREPRTQSLKEALQKALKWQALLDSGKVPNRSELARQEGVSPARVTQVMCLLRLAPEIMRHIQNLPQSTHHSAITGRALRPITKIEDHREQLEAFMKLYKKMPELLRPSPIPRHDK